MQQIGGSKLIQQSTGLFKIAGNKNLRQSYSEKEMIIYFFFCDGSFSIFSYAYASQFYDAFFSYHKAY